MARPKDTDRCAVCTEKMLPRCSAADFMPGDARTHLQFMWDRRIITHCQGMPDEEVEQHMVEYALNRMLAPFRDNKNKKEGKQADRIYKSRNTKSAGVLALKCHVRRGPTQCMRNAGHPDDDGRGGHKF